MGSVALSTISTEFKFRSAMAYFAKAKKSQVTNKPLTAKKKTPVV